MAIPGLRPSFDVRGKVRIGERKEKHTERGVREYPAALDYFICPDDGEFEVKLGQPKTLRIQLPFARPEENFTTGLEQWQGQMLVCYAKGETRQGEPVAWRKRTMKKNGADVDLTTGFRVIGEEIGNGRVGVACAVRNCPILKKKDCKPMGRLQFWIDGFPPEAGIFQIDTKSWNSIENIEGLLLSLGDPRGRWLTLGVRIEQQGRDKFPVLYMEAEPVECETTADVTLADRLADLRFAIEQGKSDVEKKQRLAKALDVTNPGWRESQSFIDGMVKRFEESSVTECCEKLLARYAL